VPNALRGVFQCFAAKPWIVPSSGPGFRADKPLKTEKRLEKEVGE